MDFGLYIHGLWPEIVAVVHPALRVQWKVGCPSIGHTQTGVSHVLGT